MSVSTERQLLRLSFVSMIRVEPFEVRDIELERLGKALKGFDTDVALRPRLMGS